MMLLWCYSSMAFLPIYMLRWVNLIYSAVMLWVYQYYVEMITSHYFNGLIIKKNTSKTILYVHSGFHGISTCVNDLGFNIDISNTTGLTILTVDYNNENLELGLNNVANAYSWLKHNSEEVILMGSGIGCYLITMLLSSGIFKDKTKVVFFSPITRLDICLTKTCQDNLNFDAVNYALCNHSSYEIDLKKLSQKITRLFVAYGDKDMFSYYTDKFIHQMKKRLEVTEVKCNNAGHCYMLSGVNTADDYCLHELDDFLRMST